MERPNAWSSYTPENIAELNKLSENYKIFLNRGKTERECVSYAVELAEAEGFRNIEEFIESGTCPKPGTRLYAVGMKKMMALFKLGEKPVSQGMNILGAHIDSPRLDVKQNPLYDTEDMAYLDTHYYGGIKKYQWVAVPMAIHGVVAKKDGTVIDITIGEREDDPVFCFTDLLIHLAQNQLKKTGALVVEGENLDLLVGNRPIDSTLLGDDEKATVKANILAILKDSYGIEEEDFLSAELEIVPAGKARDCGLDKSMIMAYGQDDRVCAYPSLQAILDVPDVSRTACCLLVDKEEIGSVGATGMQSRFFENIVAELVALTEGESDLKTRRALQRSRMLSSDVSAAYDPLYSDVFEKRSAALMSKGISFNKFTGSRGKSGSNDANAEYIGRLRRVMEDAEVKFQITELGKVDAGGGGTIAYIMGNYGMEVIDSGVAVLNMHAPYEISSKADIYEAYKGYMAFLTNM